MKHKLSIKLFLPSPLKALLIWLLYACFFLLPVVLLAQNQFKDTKSKEQLLKVLTNNLEQGDVIALRDLGKIYDKNSDNQLVVKLLKQYTFFTEKEWNWQRLDEKTTFTNFFYNNVNDFQFSELLGVFYLTSIEGRQSFIDIKLKKNDQTNPLTLRNSIQKMSQLLRKKNVKALLKEINQIGQITNPAIFTILSNLLDKNAFHSLKTVEQQQVVNQILTYLPDSIAFEKLLVLCQKEKFKLSFCQEQLALITNNYINAQNHNQLVEEYKNLLATFDNNLMAVKEYGYQKVDLTPSQFFQKKVDYYGWIAAISGDSLFWIQRNAIVAMLQTHQPKALFYIAGLNFKYWKRKGSNNTKLINLIQNNIDVIIRITEQKGLTDLPSSLKGQVEFTNYWSLNYDNYEWDDFEQKFVNQQIFSDELAAYGRYFRRLNSENDSIAYKSFIALSKGKPNEIQQLIKKFKPLLRNYNERLPPLKYKILEQVSVFTHYCRQNEIAYQPSSVLKKALVKLLEPILPQERLDIENKLIKNLKIEDLTILEYYGAINAQNLAVNYSIARILDYLYIKYWPTIVANESHFRLFLLKAQLFQGFGGFGMSKKYDNKLNLFDANTFNLLRNLEKLETNRYIQKSIGHFLNQGKELTASDKIRKFLTEPDILSREEIKELPPFGQQELPEILRALFLNEDRKATQKIGAYIELYASVAIIPQLFETPQERWTSNKYAGKALVNVLEKVYQFSFNIKQQVSIVRWWKLWDAMSENYADWSQFLFRQQFDQLSRNKNITIEDINSVTNSTFFTQKHRMVCLNSLSKIKKSRTVYRLQIAPKLSVKEELIYLEDILFSAKELANIPKIFQVDDPKKLLDFIFQKSKNASIVEKSSLYNNLFRQAWFLEYITSGAIDREKCEAIKIIFYKYLSESTFLTEYEEQTTQLNIVHLENAFLTLKEKLARIANDSLNEAIRYDYLNATLSRIEFPQILVVFPIIKDMRIADKNLFRFLNRDFGLPIFDVPTEKIAQKLMIRLKTNNEYEFYEQTLVDFGLPILKKSGKLNFQKIHQILDYDLAIPFLGGGGKYRDYYIYGLIKLLELHFKTTLGFHPKLNENQTFYTFNSYNRVGAWMDYLVKNELTEGN